MSIREQRSQHPKSPQVLEAKQATAVMYRRLRDWWRHLGATLWPPPPSTALKWNHMVLVLGGAVMVYLNSVRGDLVHDDIPTILANPDVNGKQRDWKAAFENDFWGTPMGTVMSHNSYRPITILLFR